MRGGGLLSSATTNSLARTLEVRFKSSALSAPVLMSFLDFLQSTASSISRMLAHMVPTKPVGTCTSSKSTSDSKDRLGPPESPFRGQRRCEAHITETLRIEVRDH